MNINATLLVQALSFAALIWFAVRFVWPMITDAIDERNKRIADGLAAADEGRRTLSEARDRGELEIRQARERAAELLGQAEHRATQIVEEARTAAKGEGDRLLAAAKADIDQEAARARDALRDQVAALAVAGAEKILRREVDAQAHAELLSQLKQDLR
jgi:F-type H+-transporting ATPase subunit b